MLLQNKSNARITRSLYNKEMLRIGKNAVKPKPVRFSRLAGAIEEDDFSKNSLFGQTAGAGCKCFVYDVPQGVKQAVLSYSQSQH